MPLSFSLVWKDQTLIYFQWWLHCRFALACCLIPSTPCHPVTLEPLPPSPLPPRSWLDHGSPVDVLASPCTAVSHPAPISQTPFTLNLCVHAFCTALSVCHIHNGTHLSAPLSPLLTSALYLSTTYLDYLSFCFPLMRRQKYDTFPAGLWLQCFGDLMSLGVITRWLLIGPFPSSHPSWMAESQCVMDDLK